MVKGVDFGITEFESALPFNAGWSVVPGRLIPLRLYLKNSVNCSALPIRLG